MAWRTGEIFQDDTLQRVALRYLGSAIRWPDIALLNNLKPPYLAAKSADGVLAYGDSILLPIFQPDAISKAGDEFLKDILLDDDGFIGCSDTDLAVAGKEDNLYQALSLRASVSKTSLMFHPEYGSWAFTLIGNINTNSLGALAAFYTKSALLEDPRVKSVDEVKITVTGDTLTVKAAVLPIYGEVIVYEFSI
jgi:hypothetical protein